MGFNSGFKGLNSAEIYELLFPQCHRGTKGDMQLL